MSEFVISSELSTNPRVVIIKTVGYIDDKAAEKIKNVVQSFISKGERNFLFNFASSPIINSTGISIMLEISEDITFTLQGTVVFCCLSKAINEVFKMMGISSMYKIFHSEAEALNYLSNANNN